MTGPAWNISRRAIIATAGGLAAASALPAEALIHAASQSDATRTRVHRISLVALDAMSVADALQRFVGSTALRTLSPIAQAGVHTECFWIGDTLIEVSQPSTDGREHDGHLVGLEMPSPGILRDRAHAAGLRLVRDMTVRGQRLVQPEIRIPGLRLEASASLHAPSPPGHEISVVDLKIVADHPARTARQIAALFGGIATGRTVNFPSRALQLVPPQTSDARRGIAEITLNARDALAQSARIAGVTWRVTDCPGG